MQSPQVNPVVVRVVEAPTKETSVADILMGAVGLVGFVLVAAFAVGLLAGGLFILYRKLRARLGYDEPTASVAPSTLTR